MGFLVQRHADDIENVAINIIKRKFKQENNLLAIERLHNKASNVALPANNHLNLLQTKIAIPQDLIKTPHPQPILTRLSQLAIHPKKLRINPLRVGGLNLEEAALAKSARLYGCVVGEAGDF
jgi:hypothetical protein